MSKEKGEKNSLDKKMVKKKRIEQEQERKIIANEGTHQYVLSHSCVLEGSRKRTETNLHKRV